MKKNLSLNKTILSILFATIFGLSSKSQSLGLSVSNTSSCVTTGTNPVYCTITSTVSGAVAYSYSVIQTCSGGTTFASAGTYTTLNPTIYLSCTGPYTVFCNAIGSASTIVGSATATGAFNSASAASILISPNNGVGCIGTTFTINLSGATSYTTNGYFGSTNSATIVATPSAASCFTVSAANGTCIANSVRCFTLNTPPSINLSPTIAACSNSNYTIAPTGASSYTWSNGSTSPFIIITPTTPPACYTVTGSSPFCAGTSSAVTCVTIVPGPTLSASSSTTALCLGSGGINLNASGASQFTWAVSGNSLSTVYLYSSSVVFTPTVAGNYFAQVTGNLGGCSAITSVNFTVSTPPSVSTSSNVVICAGGANLFASGATSYTWSNGTIGSSNFVNPSSSTCYTVIGSKPGCVNTSSAIACVSVSSSPSLSLSGPGSVCPGTINTYTISGANNYTWTSIPSASFFVSGSIANISSNLGCFTVTGYNTSGCWSTYTFCQTQLPSPTITVVSSSSNICAGNSVTLTASGAATYSWSNGSNANSIVVSPTSSGCYTVNGTSAAGCGGSNLICVNVMANPNITINGAASGCPGANATFTANGAATYTWNTGSNNNQLTVSPSSSTCYTVSGTSASGCINSASHCYSLLPAPSINVSGSNTVCVGSSTTFTANGGTTYTWSTGSNSNTLNVLPSTSTNYTVSASHALNACTNSTVVSVTVLTTCAIVWPGDANRDGQVDNSDVFEIGLASGSTGAARTSASTSWNGQFASAWTGNVSTGWNKAHADCNGDGTINNTDLGAISSNFALTHSFKNASANGLDLVLSPQNSEIYGGVWNVIDILLGDATNSQSQIYGAAFDLSFDQNMVQSDSVKIVYTSSFLNAGNQNIEFEKTFFNNGKSYGTSVRVDHADVSGNGKIAELWVKLRADNADNSSFNVGISNGKKVTANGVSTALSTSGAMNLNLNNNATGIKQKNASLNGIRFYPNPVNEHLVLVNDLNLKTTYRVSDLTGRIVLTGDFTSNQTLNVSNLSQGVYIVEFETSQGKVQKKFVKE